MRTRDFIALSGLSLAWGMVVGVAGVFIPALFSSDSDLGLIATPVAIAVTLVVLFVIMSRIATVLRRLAAAGK